MEKIIYPALGGFIVGFIILVIASTLKIAISEIELIVFMTIGFVFANYIKAQKLVEKTSENKK